MTIPAVRAALIERHVFGPPFRIAPADAPMAARRCIGAAFVETHDDAAIVIAGRAATAHGFAAGFLAGVLAGGDAVARIFGMLPLFIIDGDGTGGERTGGNGKRSGEGSKTDKSDHHFLGWGAEVNAARHPRTRSAGEILSRPTGKETTL
ncbi:MAG: hypothetical protein Q7T81_01530 [Pseudolabrys sp.]|nr:hypothetical protein [Pseudolabrys sp.]